MEATVQKFVNGTHSETNMPNTPIPMRPPASTGEIQWMEGYDVHPNQNMATTRHQPEMTHSSRRFSGFGGAGAILAAWRWYRGSMIAR